MRTFDPVRKNPSSTFHDPLAFSRPEFSGNPLPQVLAVIPAYNEERFIGSVVLQARLAGLSVLVVDDGSQDRTAEIATAAGAMIQRHQENQGKAEALNTAFQYARSSEVSALVVLDGDGQHNASEIRTVLAPILAGEADISIGSRFLTSSKGDIPAVRRIGQKAMTLATNLGSGVSITDSQSGFRAFSRRAIESLLFGAKGFSVEVEIQFGARDHNLTVVEVPITAIYADPPKRNVFDHGLQVLDGVLHLIGRHRPLLFFSLLGTLLLLIGVAFGIGVIDIYSKTGVLAMGYSLVSALFTIVGMLVLVTGVMLHSIRGVFLDLEKKIVNLSLGIHGPGQ